ncbi:gastrula zinc finger protein XlCGF48.2-like [Culicoides brevitarsis]|uniref:gastrula zinc finger protein XlCGF48.2-like n=1 Tax=Culicoides brevitarsis TaxID=469753 RepID=UPI00307C436B
MEFGYFSEIEGLNSVSDDFLSNGFHQFYTELQDEQLDFEPLVSSIAWNDLTLPVIEEPDAKNNVDQVNFVSYVVQEDPRDNLLDLDYILMDLPLDTNDNLLENLPEMTPLCNDSCSFFLKESAENLKLPSFDGSNFKIEVLPSELSEKSSTNLKNTQISDTPKTLICDFEGCGKSYAKPTHLKAHLKRHLNDKPYICHWPECKWRFSRSDELARHRRSHLGIKPYSCCFCSKSFARSDHLTKHRRVHEKKFNAMCKGEKHTIVWPAVPRGRPGRKPKPKNGEINENIKYFNTNEVIKV